MEAKSVVRRKDAPTFAIGGGEFLSVAFVASDLGTTRARARALIRALRVPILKLPGTKRLFVHRAKYKAAIEACEIDPSAAPRRRKR